MVDPDSLSAVYLLFDVGHDIFTEGDMSHMPDIKRFLNRDGNCYVDNVLRDFLRYGIIYYLYEGCVVR